MAKILFFDIETRPNLAYVWGKWQQNALAFKEDWSMLSFAYKWQGDKEVRSVSAQHDKTDLKLVKALHGLIEEADIVVAHNGDEFDMKKFRARCLVHGLSPHSPVRTVDTLKVAKKHFAFTSNSLDDLGQVLGVGRKESTGGFQLWLDCMAGKKAAWAKMLKYNRRDVDLLERVYNKMLPWIDNHPNVAQLAGHTAGCSRCGHPKMIAQGLRHTKTATYRRYQCVKCRGWSQARLQDKTVAKLEIV